MNKPKFGLQELPKDKRDFSLGAVVKLPALSELPADFVHEPIAIKDQGDTDFCSAFATCGMSELQEGVVLEESYAFQAGKELSGKPEEWGQNMRTAMDAHRKIGCIEKSESPFSLANKESDFLRNPENWPKELKTKALKHAKSSYFTVDGPYDAFDNIRATIWLYRDEKRVPGLGVRWSWPLDQAEIEEVSDSGFGHMVYALGWKTLKGQPYLVVQNSYGLGAGKNGQHYFSREVINKWAEKYGCYMFVDMTKEEYLERLKPAIQLSIVEILKNLLEAIRRYLNPPATNGNVPDEKPVRPPFTPVETKPETTRDMVLRICREEKMSYRQTEQILATINCESGFNSKAINRNTNGTVDYGICQYNSKWYIGPGKPIPSVEVALNDPEFCVRVMCRMFKKGRQRDWICYRRIFPNG